MCAPQGKALQRCVMPVADIPNTVSTQCRPLTTRAHNNGPLPAEGRVQPRVVPGHLSPVDNETSRDALVV